MKKFEIRRRILTIIALAPVAACKKSVDISPRSVRWDQDICTRCAMHLSDPLNAAQIIDKKTGQVYFFDDLGCAVLWLRTNAVLNKDDAVIYVTDAIDSAWLQHNKAVYAFPYVTPMSFSVSAFSDKNKVGADKTILTFDQAIAEIVKIHEQRKHAGGQGHHMATDVGKTEDVTQ